MQNAKENIQSAIELNSVSCQLIQVLLCKHSHSRWMKFTYNFNCKQSTKNLFQSVEHASEKSLFVEKKWQRNVANSEYLSILRYKHNLIESTCEYWIGVHRNNTKQILLHTGRRRKFVAVEFTRTPHTWPSTFSWETSTVREMLFSYFQHQLSGGESFRYADKSHFLISPNSSGFCFFSIKWNGKSAGNGIINA